jgi:outer membrane protein TolC
MKNKMVTVIILLIFSLDTFGKTELHLNDLIELALQNNGTLKMKYENIEIKENDYKISVSKLFPNIDFKSSYNILNDENVVGNLWSNDYILSDKKLSAYIILNQPIYNNSSLKNKKKSAFLDKNIAELEFESEKERIVYMVSFLYYDLLQQIKLLELNNNLHEQLSNDKNITLKLIEAGKAINLDVLKINVEIVNIEKNIEINKTKIEYLKNQLKIYSGLNLEKEIYIYIPYFNLNNNLMYSKEEFINAAYKNRNDLLIYNNNLKSIEYKIKIVNSENMPTLNLAAQYGYDMSENESFDSWKISLEMNFNIFDGGNNKFNLNKLRAEYVNIETGIDEIKKNIKADINYEYDYLNTLNININKSIENIKYARENLEIEKTKYDIGDNRIIDLIDARNILFEAEEEYYVSILNFKKTQLKLYMLSGNLNKYVKEIN